MCGGTQVPNAIYPRHLRTHDALTVGVPFLPGASRHSGLLPRQLLVVRIPAENDRYFFDATPGPNINLKTLKPFARLACNSTHRLSGSVRFGQRFLGRCLSYWIFRCFRLISRSFFAKNLLSAASRLYPSPGDSLQPLDRQVR